MRITRTWMLAGAAAVALGCSSGGTTDRAWVGAGAAAVERSARSP